VAAVISIIIPTYNRALDLKRALKSVQAQKFTNWEALIIDNHSKDNTDDVVSSFNDIRMKLYKIYNKGVIAASRNKGICEASGEYIAFLDSDDWWTTEKLSLSFDELNLGADVVYHDMFLVSRPRQKIFWKKARTRNLVTPVFNDLLLNGNALVNSGVVVRKKLLIEINGLSENSDLIATEDYDCWLKISKLTNRFTRISQPLGYYWTGGGNVSNPERTLEAINSISQRYLEEGQYNNQPIIWMTYARGRAYYIQRNYQKAYCQLVKINRQNSSLDIYLKSRWMLIQAVVRNNGLFKLFVYSFLLLKSAINILL
jgi:glycosyltransferase involved in cell wall biosynthesis